MAISFPDTASAAMDFSGGSVRAQGASKSQSQSETGIDGCGVCPAEKSLDESDDFNAVLGWMMSGVGPQVQQVPVADKSKETSTAAISEGGSIETATSLGFGQALAQVKMAALTSSSSGNTSALPSGSPQISSPQIPSVPSEPAKSLVSVAGGDAEPFATIGLDADTSSNVDLLLQGNESPDEVAASVQFQPKAITANPDSVQSVEFQSMEPLFSGPAASDVTSGSEVQTTTFDMTFVSPSDSPGLPEALSQDAIDALERIGLLPRLMLVESSESVTQNHQPGKPVYNGSMLVGSSESVTSGTNPTTSVLPVNVTPTVSADVLSESAIENSKPPVSIPSTISESRLLKQTTPADVQSTGDLIASSRNFLASSDSKLPVASAQELPVSDSEPSEMPAVMDTMADSNATEIESPLVVAAPAPELKMNSGSVMYQLGRPIESQNVESILRPVRHRPTSGAVPNAVGKSELPPARESRTNIASSFDRTPNEVSPLSVANSFSNFTASVSSEMRQPLSSQVSHAILAHIEHSGVRSNDSLSVRLDPPELGEMRIELSKTLEGLAVRVTASEAVTMDMLLARGQEIETQLRGQQMNLKSLEFLQPGMLGHSFSQGQQNAESRTSEKLMNQVRRGSRSSGPANPVVGRIVTPDSAYGLSFRA